MRAGFIAISAALGLLSSAALAADLPNTKGPPAFAPPPVFTWTGLYIGGQVGYEWGTTGGSEFYLRAAPAIFGPTNSYSPGGVLGGAHLGYNYQISQFVLGVEGDVDGAEYSGRATSPDILVPGVAVTESTRIGIQGSVRGRVGWAWDRVLFYGTGGVAFASIQSGFSDSLGPATASSTVDRVGWTAGGGIEYAIDNNWSLRAEYRYSDFGRVTYALDAASGAPGVNFTKRVTTNQVTAGFSYKFDLFAPPGPIAAKY
ncbi:MAG: outer membrane protein [Methylovirgula sp.]